MLVPSVALTAGCASKGRLLMPTPALYQQEPWSSRLFAETAPERRTPGVELLYITDRATETSPGSTQPYGEGRSRSLAFGMALVEIGPGLSWSDLEYRSRLFFRQSLGVDLAFAVLTNNREQGPGWKHTS